MQQKDSKNSFGKEESSQKTEKERKITSKKAARLITLLLENIIFTFEAYSSLAASLFMIDREE
ncbi:hypothetical protein Tco_0917894, partial [Tanacetum coccineum]